MSEPQVNPSDLVVALREARQSLERFDATSFDGPPAASLYLRAANAIERLQRIETAARRLLSLVEAKGAPRDGPENQALLQAGDTIAVNEGNLWALQMEINS